MSPVAIILGSAASCLEELEAARAIAPDAPVVCVNDSFRICPVHPVAFATLHAEKSRRFLEGLNLSGVRRFAHEQRSRAPHAFEIVKEKWGGTSGLFAVQIALCELGYHGVILAGVPLDHKFGTSYKMDKGRTRWAGGSEARYQRNWRRALPFLRARVRSMSGWTLELLGGPSAEWIAGLEAVAVLRPDEVQGDPEGPKARHVVKRIERVAPRILPPHLQTEDGRDPLPQPEPITQRAHFARRLEQMRQRADARRR